MKTEKRRVFIINFIYFSIIVLSAFILLKYVLPMFSPFVIGFIIAWILKGPIGFISRKLRIKGNAAAVLVVALFYCTIGIFMFLLGLKAFSSAGILIRNLPGIYAGHVEPVLVGIFDSLEQSLPQADTPLLVDFKEIEAHFVQSLGQMVSSLSMNAMGHISGAASSLPGLFIRTLIMIISTFFIAADYKKLTDFAMAQLNEKSKAVFLQIKEYVVGTLFVCIRSYALIMSITFVELALGLTIMGIKNSVLIALLISIFDILPVLGTGGIMIPWVILTALQKNYSLALGLLLVYLFITVVRNILEPKIVGSQIGLHPVVTLAGIFVGAQLFGVIGLFCFPIAISLLWHLNDNGTIKLFRTADH